MPTSARLAPARPASADDRSSPVHAHRRVLVALSALPGRGALAVDVCSRQPHRVIGAFTRAAANRARAAAGRRLFTAAAGGPR